MKVALLGDVHGNLPALEAVLADAGVAGAEAVWNLGDFVGYGPFPDEVVCRLQAAGAVSIVGNYDLKVLAFWRNKAKWARRKAPEKFLAFRWAAEHLSPAARRHLRGLPREVRLEVEGLRVLLTHGSPASNEEPLGPDTPAGRLRELAALAGADVVACGHSHRAMDRRAGGVRFVNPGSVGRPEGDDPRAAYAMLTIRGGRLSASRRRVEYDVQRAVRAIREQRLPEEFAAMLLKGTDLGGVRAAGRRGRDARGHVRPAQDMPTARFSSPKSDNVGMAPSAEDAACIEAALALARRCEYEAGHTHQVTRLALVLFDALRPAHGLRAEDRFLLHCGGLLHDIGWIEGQKGHHKTACRIILGAKELPLDERARRIVALIARYHRKGPPGEEQAEFAALSPADRRRVRVLAGVLRVADGLDRSHRDVVRGLACRLTRRRLAIRCDVTGPAAAERWAAGQKADLLAEALGREVVIEMSGEGG